MKRRLKTNGAIIFLAVVLLILFPAVFLRSARENHFHTAAKIAGITLILLGQTLRACARGYKSEYSRNGCSLIQGGPYTLVRNPMYLGILIIGLGIVLTLFNWWEAVIFLSVFIWRYIFLIFKEEKKLLTMFPQEYRNYRQKVPRILPALATILQKDIAEYLPLKLSWLKKEIGSILAVLLLVFFLEGWKGVQAKSINLYLKEATLLLAIVILFIFLTIYLIRRTNNQQKDASTESKNTL